jgi:hypothetical protein
MIMCAAVVQLCMLLYPDLGIRHATRVTPRKESGGTRFVLCTTMVNRKKQVDTVKGEGGLTEGWYS